MLIGIYSQRKELKNGNCKLVGRAGKQNLIQG